MDEALNRLLSRARREVDDGLLPACQVAVAVDGDIVGEAAFGEAGLGTRFVMFSCTKALVAGAVWRLLGEGRVRLDQRVAEIVPEFGTHGKRAVTIEHLLLHTAGFPNALLPPEDWSQRERRLDRFASWRLESAPGSRFEYHPMSASWVLAEVIHRVTGRDHRTIVSEMTGDLGLPRLRLGVGLEEQHDIAEIQSRGEPATTEQLLATFGTTTPAAAPGQAFLVALNDPSCRSAGEPGGGAVGTAHDLAMYYQALLRNPGGFWDAATLSDGTSNARNRLPDPMLGIPAFRTIGLVVAGDDGKASLRGFGRGTSPFAFGHNGFGGQVAWADPSTRLSFACLTNGVDMNVVRQGRRVGALNNLAAACASPSAVSTT